MWIMCIHQVLKRAQCAGSLLLLSRSDTC